MEEKYKIIGKNLNIEPKHVKSLMQLAEKELLEELLKINFLEGCTLKQKKQWLNKILSKQT